MTGGKLSHSSALSQENALGRREQPSSALPDRSVKRRRKVLRVLDVADERCHPQRRGHLLQCLHLQGRDRIDEEGQHKHPRDSGNSFLQ